jgi:serine/threonine protein kinase
VARGHQVMLAIASCLQAYGIVWKALDKKTGEIIALKKIFDAFQNATDAQASEQAPPFCCSVVAAGVRTFIGTHVATSDGGSCCLQRTFREIMFLQELNNHENIIRSAMQGTPCMLRCCAWGTPCEHVTYGRCCAAGS